MMKSEAPLLQEQTTGHHLVPGSREAYESDNSNNTATDITFNHNVACITLQHSECE